MKGRLKSMRIRTLTVSELNRYIKKLLNYDPILSNISIKGEISNLKFHGNGHLYFSLKDEQSKISCVMFKGNCKTIKFDIHNGIKVIVKGSISVFERNGQYQFYAENIEPDGIGALHLTFEQLKSKLEKEGLFDTSYKKTLPSFPKKIAVITSLTGAVIRDIISITKRRNNCVEIIIFPVLVQGESAASQISNAIRKVNDFFSDIDIIILARGGGSIEELWAFNEEIVARSIFDSNIPIISAVGHETDYTISDFVSDLRAPTPSTAAELAVPRILDVQNTLDKFYYLLNESVLSKIKEKKSELKQWNKSKLFSCVQDKLQQNHQLVDILQKDLSNNIRIKFQIYKGKLIENAAKLETLNPISTISRGYALLLDSKNNLPIDSIKKIKTEQSIKIILKDGVISCDISKIEKGDNLLEQLEKFKITKQ